MRKIARALREAEDRLRTWYEHGDCHDAETEEYLIGRIEGLRLALDLAKGANG